MSKIDCYLLQSLRANEAEPAMPTVAMFPTAASIVGAVNTVEMNISAEDLESGIKPLDQAEAAILLCLRMEQSDWNGAESPGLRIHSRLGSVISAHSSPESLRAFERDDAVYSIGAPRPLEGPGALIELTERRPNTKLVSFDILGQVLAFRQTPR